MGSVGKGMMGSVGGGVLGVGAIGLFVQFVGRVGLIKWEIVFNVNKINALTAQKIILNAYNAKMDTFCYPIKHVLHALKIVYHASCLMKFTLIAHNVTRLLDLTYLII